MWMVLKFLLNISFVQNEDLLLKAILLIFQNLIGTLHHLSIIAFSRSFSLFLSLPTTSLVLLKLLLLLHYSYFWLFSFEGPPQLQLSSYVHVFCSVVFSWTSHMQVASYCLILAPIWNRLPAEAVNSASVEQFKIELDKVIDTLIWYFFFFFFFLGVSSDGLASLWGTSLIVTHCNSYSFLRVLFCKRHGKTDGSSLVSDGQTLESILLMTSFVYNFLHFTCFLCSTDGLFLNIC